MRLDYVFSVSVSPRSIELLQIRTAANLHDLRALSKSLKGGTEAEKWKSLEDEGPSGPSFRLRLSVDAATARATEAFHIRRSAERTIAR